MAKEAVFTLKLEAELRDALMADAEEVDRPASQIMRELLKDYLKRREEEKRSYNEFLRRKVERSRRSIADGRWHSNEDVETEFAARRKALLRRVDGSDA
jgi:predicted transcriptional regulator